MVIESGSEEWHIMRARGIGGSDAAVIIGVSPWKSELELWTEKVYGKRREFNNNNLMKWGNLLEPLIVTEYENITGRKVTTYEDECHFQNSVYNFMIGNVDGIIIDDNKGYGILEIKTKNPFTKWNSDWKEGNIPEYYKIQFQHYLMISGYKYGSFAILDLGSMEVVWFDVERDYNLIDEIIDKEVAFWDKVKKKEKPDVDNSKSCNEFLRDCYNSSDDELDVLDLKNNDDANYHGIRLSNAKDDIKEAKKIEIESQNYFMSVMEYYEKAIGDQFNITWKFLKSKEVFDMKLFKKENVELYYKYVSMKEQSRRFLFKY